MMIFARAPVLSNLIYTKTCAVTLTGKRPPNRDPELQLTELVQDTKALMVQETKVGLWFCSFKIDVLPYYAQQSISATPGRRLACVAKVSITSRTNVFLFFTGKERTNITAPRGAITGSEESTSFV